MRTDLWLVFSGWSGSSPPKGTKNLRFPLWLFSCLVP